MLTAMGRQDIVSNEEGKLYYVQRRGGKVFSDGTPFKPNQLFFCKAHFELNADGKADVCKPVPPSRDPTLCGADGTVFNEAFAKQDGFWSTRYGIARKAAVDAHALVGMAEKARQDEARAGRSDMRGLGLHGLPADISPVVGESQQLRDLSGRVADLEGTIAEQARAIRDLEARLQCSVRAITYDSLTATAGSALRLAAEDLGFSEAESRSFTRLKPLRLVGLVSAMEATQCHVAWEAAVKALAHRKRRLLDHGFRNAVALVFVHMAAGTTLRQTAWACKLPLEAAGDVFDITIRVINRFYRETFAVPQLVQQLDEDQLPAFAPAVLDQFLLTADATNIRLDFKPLTPEGARASYSPYYGANCGKFELVTYPDGRVAWVSLVCGGASSEEKIVHKAEDEDEGMPQIEFREFYQRFQRGCVDEDGVPFNPGLLADKGTHMDATMADLDALYLTPSSTAGESILSYRDIISNEIISKARGHVERAIGKAKRWRMLKTGIHHRQVHNIDHIAYFAAFSTHLLD